MELPLFLLYDLMTITINDYLVLIQLPGNSVEADRKQLQIILIHKVIQLKKEIEE